MNPSSDIQNHMLGLVGPLDRGVNPADMLNDRALNAGDFLNRVGENRKDYAKAAKDGGHDLNHMEQRLQSLVEAAKAAGPKPAPKEKDSQ